MFETFVLTLFGTIREGLLSWPSILALLYFTVNSSKWFLAPSADKAYLFGMALASAYGKTLFAAIMVMLGKLITPYFIRIPTGRTLNRNFSINFHLGKNPELQTISRQPRKGKSSETKRQTPRGEDIVRTLWRHREHRRNDDARSDYNTIRVGNIKLGEIYFDRIFAKVKNVIVDPMKQQSDMKLKAMALNFNDYLCNGDGATDPLGFVGLKKRVALMPASQTIRYAGVAGGSTAALDVTGSVANVITFFKKLEEQVAYTRAGDVNAILCNLAMKLGIGHAARFVNASGGSMLGIAKDSFDRDIPTYRGIPIVDAGLKRDQSTSIITDTEVADDSGADMSSIYTMAFGEQDGITGIQLPPGIEAYDPLNGGESPTAPAVMKRFEWVLGLAGFGSYGITRGMNVEGASNWTA